MTEQRKGLYAQSRKLTDAVPGSKNKEKETVKAQITEITERLKVIRKEVRLCEGIEARSETLRKKMQIIRAEEMQEKEKEMMKNEHRRRSGRTNRKDELRRS